MKTGNIQTGQSRAKTHLNNNRKEEYIGKYNSISEAAIITNTDEKSIANVINQYIPKNRKRPRQTAGGFKWVKCNDYPEREYTQASGSGERLN